MGLPETPGRSALRTMQRAPLYAWWRGMGGVMEVPNAGEP